MCVMALKHCLTKTHSYTNMDFCRYMYQRQGRGTQCVMYQWKYYLYRLSSLLSTCSGTMCGTNESSFRDAEHERQLFKLF